MGIHMASKSLNIPTQEVAGTGAAGRPFARRVLNWRTLLSFGVAVAILVLAIKKAGIHWQAALCVLLLVWLAGDHILRLLPHRLHDVFTHFRHGASTAFGRDVPMLIGQTVVVWLLEGARFAFILAALGLLSVTRTACIHCCMYAGYSQWVSTVM